MRKIKNTLIVTLFFLIVSIIPNSVLSQNDKLEEFVLSLRNELQFDDWNQKNKGLRYGIKLSELNIKCLAELQSDQEVKPFSVSRMTNKKWFVKSRKKWTQSQNGFIEVTMSFFESPEEAHQYVFDYYILGSNMPLQLLKSAKDSSNIIGVISFFNGKLFIRNNIVVNVHAEGQVREYLKEVTESIDSVILQQEEVENIIDLRPQIDYSSGKRIILLPNN